MTRLQSLKSTPECLARSLGSAQSLARCKAGRHSALVRRQKCHSKVLDLARLSLLLRTFVYGARSKEGKAQQCVKYVIAKQKKVIARLYAASRAADKLN